MMTSRPLSPGLPSNSDCESRNQQTGMSTVSYAIWFGIVFVVFFVLRGIITTWLFLLLLPEGTRCPNCDEITLRVESRGWNRLLPWFRTSWCYRCGWEGLLRNGVDSETVESAVYSERSS